jgi:predicted nucleic acid-binding protein
VIRRVGPTVVDASALVEFLLRTSRGRALDEVITDPRVDLHAPGVCDLEVVSALRRLLRRNALSVERAEEFLSDYLDLTLTRHGHEVLLPRIFGLRDNVSAYDAAYLALAEALEGPLIAADARLIAAARVHTAVVTLG